MTKKKSRKNSKKPVISFGKLEVLEEPPAKPLEDSDKQKESFLKERLSKISEKSFEKFLSNEVLSPIHSVGKNHIYDILKQNEKIGKIISNNSFDFQKQKLQKSVKMRANHFSRNFLKKSFQKKVHVQTLNSKSKLGKRREHRQLGQNQSNFTSLEVNAFKKNKQQLSSLKRIQVEKLKTKEGRQAQASSREERHMQSTNTRQTKSTKKKTLGKLKTNRAKHAAWSKSPTFAGDSEVCAAIKTNPFPFLTMGYKNELKPRTKKRRKSSVQSLERSGASENQRFSSFYNSQELKNNSMIRFSHSNEKVLETSEKVFDKLAYFEKEIYSKNTLKKPKLREISNPLKRLLREEDSLVLPTSGRQKSEVFLQLPRPKKLSKLKTKNKSKKGKASFRQKTMSQLGTSKYKANLLKFKLKQL